MELSIKNEADIIPKLGQVIYVAGSQWGDEGKGKLVDILAEKYDIEQMFFWLIFTPFLLLRYISVFALLWKYSKL